MPERCQRDTGKTLARHSPLPGWHMRPRQPNGPTSVARLPLPAYNPLLSAVQAVVRCGEEGIFSPVLAARFTVTRLQDAFHE
jgi:hypothetical protein